MPRLLIDRKKTGSKRPVPPCGRKITYVLPHSPFQKLVTIAMRRHGYSSRALSAKIGMNNASFWAWLHNEKGYPEPKALTPERLKRISAALFIPVPHLQEAVNASRIVFGAKENPMPVKQVRAFEELERFVLKDKRKTYPRARVLSIIRQFRALCDTAAR